MNVDADKNDLLARYPNKKERKKQMLTAQNLNHVRWTYETDDTRHKFRYEIGDFFDLCYEYMDGNKRLDEKILTHYAKVMDMIIRASDK